MKRSIDTARPLLRLHRLTTPTLLPASRRGRAQPAYEGHVPINGFERALLTVGSAVAALANPYRHDMVATLGETTGGFALPRMRDQMLRSPSGRALLRERPRLSTSTVDFPALRQLAPGTVGRAYVDWLDRFNVTPDSRDPVRYIDDPELAYVMQRYRESHDLYHVILGFPTSVGAEVVIKMFEYANNGLPMTLLSSVFGPFRLKSATRRRLMSTYAAWALRAGAAAEPMIAVYWEREWERSLVDLKLELAVGDPPMTWDEYRATSPAAYARHAAEAEAEVQRRAAEVEAETQRVVEEPVIKL